MASRKPGSVVDGGVVAYCRVSTGQQDLATQRHALEQIAKARGLHIGRWYEDTASGRKQSRPGLDACLGALRRGEASTLLVYRLDRIGRSLTHLVAVVEELRSLNVRIIANAGDIDTETPAGRALWGMAAVFAEFERDLITERVHAGLARARTQGVRLGRPPLMTQEQAQEAVQRAGGIRPAAKAMGCSPASIMRALQRASTGTAA